MKHLRHLRFATFPTLNVRLLLKEEGTSHEVVILRGETRLYVDNVPTRGEAETSFTAVRTTLAVLDAIESAKKGAH